MKQKTGRRLLSILLSFAMVLGLMQGMSLTARAEDATYEFTTSRGVNEYTNNIITVKGAYCDSSGIVVNDGRSIQITAADGCEITKIEMVCGYTPTPAANTEELIVTNGTITTQGVINVDNTVTIDNINAGSTTISRNEEYWLHFKSFKIYYESASVAVTGVSLNPGASQSISVGDTVTFTATVSPNNATDKKVKWSVSNSNVVLYSNEACTTAVGKDATDTLTVYAKGESAGSATVTVTATNGTDVTADDKSASCDVTVNPAVTNYNLWVGGTQVTSANASNIDGDNKVSYDAATNTLTLNGYTYSGEGSSIEPRQSRATHGVIIYKSPEDFILVNENKCRLCR